LEVIELHVDVPFVVRGRKIEGRGALEINRPQVAQVLCCKMPSIYHRMSAERLNYKFRFF